MAAAGPLAQAALVIAFLRANLTYAGLAAGFGISVTTCWRDVGEGISVLADRGRRISLAGVARLVVTEIPNPCGPGIQPATSR